MATRDEALTKARELLRKRLEHIEVVPVEMDSARNGNPWSKFAGMFKDNPLFDQVVEDMESDRRELNA